MRTRSLIAGAVVAGFFALVAPSSAVAATTATPPGCTAWIGDGGAAQGACDASVTQPWRLVARIVCGFSAFRWATEYSLESPKVMDFGCRHYDPFIELQP
jgi:hypothetical protein